VLDLTNRPPGLPLISLLLAVCLLGCAKGPATDSHDSIERAFRERRSNVQVTAAGEVTRLLSDDNLGSRHQRLIVRLASGQTVLIQHNIDLAPRVPDLAPGDLVKFVGEYEWNDEGGIVHWTHHDPLGRHPDGWIEHKGKVYK
jgi:hypothetical protein